jgi:hypothetical protein
MLGQNSGEFSWQKKKKKNNKKNHINACPQTVFEVKPNNILK